MRRMLALDLGTKTGWCVVEDGAYFGGTWDFSPRRHDGAGMRFVRFEDAMRDMLEGCELCVFEDVRGHKGTYAAQVYGGFVAVTEKLCEQMGIPYSAVKVGDIKKFATGKGNAGKEAMLAAAQEQWPGISFADDNMADAFHLARLTELSRA